jgi:predicted N-acetyltransferase YhbS
MALPIRRLKPEHLPQVEKSFNKIFGEYNRRYIVLLRDSPHVYAGKNLNNCFAVFDGRKVVAQVASRPARMVMEGADLVWASYGNVYSLPEYRGRHLASRLNHHVWGHLKRQGVDGVYISGTASIYQRMGATPCGNYLEYWCNNGTLRKIGNFRTELTVRRCRKDEAGILVGLHRNEPAGFLRREFDYRQVMTTGWAMLTRAWPWLVLHRGIPQAYVMVGPEWTMKPKPTGRGHVVDYAGSRSAIFLGLPMILRKAKYSATGLTVGGGDRELKWLMRSAGAKEKWHGVHGTQVLLNPARLVKRLQPYFERRLGSDTARMLSFRPLPGGKFEFSLGSRRHRLELKQLTCLILGSREREWNKILPGRGPLRDALLKIFPVPFPPIGLNWM